MAIEHRVRQILFVPPAPLVWATHLDAFAQAGVAVDTTQTMSSDQLGQGLAEAHYDVGIAVMDNVVAWNAERGANLSIIAQLERTTVMAFVGLARYHSLTDAAADPIAVDATTNGFVLVLYRALSRAGIDWRTCRFDPVGGVRHRYEALQRGTASSTILVPPFIDLALDAGYTRLWSGADVAPEYPGVVVAARSQWITQNREAATLYLKALLAANAWASALANHAEAIGALVAARYSEAGARRLVRDAVEGLVPARAGWDEVLALRRECGLLKLPEPRAREVIDGSLLQAARTA